MKNSIWKHLLIVALAVTSMISISRCMAVKKQSRTYLSNIKAMNDSLKFFKDRNGHLIAQTSVIRSEKKVIQAMSESKDEEIRRLADLVKKKTKTIQSATAVKTETSIDTVILDRISKSDTIWKVEYRDNWIDFTAISDLKIDSTGINLKVNNDLLIWEEYKKRGKWPFREEYLIINVLSDNPHTLVSALKSWELPVRPPRRWSVGPFAGVGINQDIKPSITVGVGVMYKIF